MDMNQVLEQVRQIQTADAAMRQAAESQLLALGESQPGALALGFAAIASEGEVEISTRQMALVLLRMSIVRYWSIGFAEYKGPIAIDETSKSKFRRVLMELIGSPERKVRASSALIVSKIASVEFPEEWPTLIDEILQNMRSENKDLVQGSLTVMHEILFDALSMEEFLQVGGTLLPILYQVACENSYSIAARTSAIACFRRSMLFYEQMENEPPAASALAQQEIPRWFQLFANLLSEPLSSHGQFSAIKLKLEILYTIRDIEVGLVDLVGANVVTVLSALWSDIQQSAGLYIENYINDDIPPIPTSEEDEDVSDALFDQLIAQEFNFLDHWWERSRQVRNTFEVNPSLLAQLARNSILYTQLPNPVQESDDEVNEFVTEENELCMDEKVRTEVVALICKITHASFVSAISQEIDAALSQKNWVHQESSLYVLGQLLATGSKPILSHISEPLSQRVSADLVNNFNSKEPLLQARSVIVMGELCKSGKVDASTRKQFLNLTMQIGLQSPNATVRAACLFPIKKYYDINKDELAPYQGVILDTVNSLVQLADEDTPAFLVEVLQHAVRLNYDIAWQTPAVIQLLFTLASRDTSNVELTTETSDVFEDIVEYATDKGQYNQVCESALPTLLNGLHQMKDFEYNPDAMLAIGLIGELLSKGPFPLPEEVLANVLRPLYQIIINADETEMLQAASEAFDYLVEHSSEQLKQWQDDGESGPEMVLKVVSKLLDPSLDDSATINTGRLISTIIEKFGADLGEIFKQLLEAAARRLSTAKNLVLVQNLVSVFCELVLKSTQEVVDILYDIHIDDSNGLAVVLTKWLGTFDVLRGYEDIRKNVVALEQLFEIDDDRIKAVIVDGDLEKVEEGIIITRSKAKALRYQKVPAHVKILKLLVNELSTTPFDTGDAKEAAWLANDGEEDDGEWEDVEDPLDDLVARFGNEDESTRKRQIDSETHSTIVNWFRRLASNNTADIRTICQTHLNPEEKGILVEHANL